MLVGPTLFGPELTGMSSRGLGPLWMHQRIGPLDLGATLRALGFKLPDLEALRAESKTAPRWSDPPAVDDTRQVVSILDLPGEAEFTRDQQEVVARWVAAARSWRKDDGWTPDRVALLRRIVREPRARNVWALDQVIAESPTVAQAVVGDVLDRSEAQGFAEARPWARAWYGLDDVDPATLAPHRDRILALLAANPDERSRLLPLVGRLGVDPGPYLLPMSADLDRRLLSDRARGACRAESRWASALVPPLRDLLATLDLDNSSDRDVAELASLALLRHGDQVWVEANLPGRGKEGARLWRNLQGRLRAMKEPETLCH